MGKYGSRERRTAWGSVVCGPGTEHKPLPRDFGLRDSRRRLFGLGVSANEKKKILLLPRPSPSCGLSVPYSRSPVIFNRIEGCGRYSDASHARLRSLCAPLQNVQALGRSYGSLWRFGIPEWREAYQRQCEVVIFHSWSSLLRICTTSRESQTRLPNAHPGPVSQLQTPPEELPPDPSLL